MNRQELLNWGFLCDEHNDSVEVNRYFKCVSIRHSVRSIEAMLTLMTFP